MYAADNANDSSKVLYLPRAANPFENLPSVLRWGAAVDRQGMGWGVQFPSATLRGAAMPQKNRGLVMVHLLLRRCRRMDAKGSNFASSG